MPSGISHFARLNNAASWPEFNTRMVLSASTLKVSGDYVRVKLRAGSSAIVVSGCSIGSRDGATVNFSPAPTRITFGASNGVTIPSGGYVWSDWIAFTLDEASNYLLHVCCHADAANAIAYEAVDTTYYKQADLDETLTESPSGYSSFGYFVLLEAIQVTDDAAFFSWAQFLNANTVTNAGYNYRQVVAQADLNAYGNQVRVRFNAAAGYGAQTLGGASIGKYGGSGGDFSAAPTRLTFSGSNSVEIADGGSVISDWVNFTLEENQDYLIHIYSQFSWARTNSDGTRYHSPTNTGGDETLVQAPGDYVLSNNSSICFDLLETQTVTPPSGPTQEQLLRHGTWFGSGVKQRMWWAK
jgi:hypothetical protein